MLLFLLSPLYRLRGPVPSAFLLQTGRRRAVPSTYTLHPLSVLQMRGRATAEELLAQAEAKGYKRGAHAEYNQVRNREKHVKKTKKD